jgi:hypothetical protein
VAQFVKDGTFQPLPNGRLDLDDCRRAYIEWLRADVRSGSKSAADDRLRELRADDLEQRMEQRSKAMVAEAEAEAMSVIDVCIGGFRADLTAIPARVTSDLALRRQIEDAINDVLNAAAKRSAETAERLLIELAAAAGEAPQKRPYRKATSDDLGRDA